MKKTILIASLCIVMQAHAITIVVPHVTPHISKSRINSTSYSAKKMTNTAKAVNPNYLKSDKVILTQGSKQKVLENNVSVGSLNSSNQGNKSFGCQVPKEDKKIIPLKCDK